MLPIFALSYACQSQLFIIYSTMADPPVERMRGIMMKMLSIVASIYALVGVLGYSSFHAEIKGTLIVKECFIVSKLILKWELKWPVKTNHRIKNSGNMLLNYKSDKVLQLIKLGFAMSVVVGFPLMIYPCRQSIFTLFFAGSKPTYNSLNDDVTFIPNSSKFYLFDSKIRF